MNKPKFVSHTAHKSVSIKETNPLLLSEKSYSSLFSYLDKVQPNKKKSCDDTIDKENNDPNQTNYDTYDTYSTHNKISINPSCSLQIEPSYKNFPKSPKSEVDKLKFFSKHNLYTQAPFKLDRGINPDLLVEEDRRFSDVFKCAICFNICFDPIECETCENIFCKSCIELAKEKGLNKCPMNCKTFPDKKVNRRILEVINKLSLKCIFGCDKIMRMDNIENHYKECKYAIYRCNSDGCNYKGILNDVIEHLKECPERKVYCCYCNKTMKKKLIDYHWEQNCNEYLVTCDKCNVTMKRKHYKNHYSKDNKNPECLMNQVNFWKKEAEKYRDMYNESIKDKGE